MALNLSCLFRLHWEKRPRPNRNATNGYIRVYQLDRSRCNNWTTSSYLTSYTMQALSELSFVILGSKEKSNPIDRDSCWAVRKRVRLRNYQLQKPRSDHSSLNGAIVAGGAGGAVSRLTSEKYGGLPIHALPYLRAHGMYIYRMTRFWSGALRFAARQSRDSSRERGLRRCTEGRTVKHTSCRHIFFFFFFFHRGYIRECDANGAFRVSELRVRVPSSSTRGRVSRVGILFRVSGVLRVDCRSSAMA